MRQKINITIPVEVIAELDREAKRLNISRSRMIENIILGVAEYPKRRTA